MITATYKGREYQIEPRLAGTANYSGVVSYGGLALSSWWGSDHDTNTLELALEVAHRRAEAQCLRSN